MMKDPTPAYVRSNQNFYILIVPEQRCSIPNKRQQLQEFAGVLLCCDHDDNSFAHAAVCEAPSTSHPNRSLMLRFNPSKALSLLMSAAALACAASSRNFWSSLSRQRGTWPSIEARSGVIWTWLRYFSSFSWFIIPKPASPLPSTPMIKIPFGNLRIFRRGHGERR